ncbi:hypothetical protein Q9R29_07710 [Rothia sp. ARF10]|nr:hypothetical protein [Rothia sp. ARF10]
MRAVGLDASVFVLAVYNDCDETSSLVLDDGVLRLVVESGDAVCGWAPVQVEVWRVPRENLPDPVVFRDQRGNPA